MRKGYPLKRLTGRGRSTLVWVAILLSATSAGLAGGATTVYADAAPPCGAATFDADGVDPGIGYVAVVDVTVAADCSLRIGPVQTLSEASILAQSTTSPTTPALGTPIADTGAASTTPDLTPNTYPYSTYATVHQRLWDCCNILLNEFDTYLHWQYNYSSVGGSYAYNATSYHTQSCCGGWSLRYQNLSYSGGGSGQTSVSVSGNAEFDYNGTFNGGCNCAFYTQYQNTMTGYQNGGYRCHWHWYWNASYPGWHMQDWCGHDVPFS